MKFFNGKYVEITTDEICGLHYSQGGASYLCNRDTVNPVYNAMPELVGFCAEEA